MPGILTKVDGSLVFFTEDGEIIPIEPTDCNFLTVLGEVGLAETQKIMDRVHGGYAKVATSRQMEVR